jgi:hypothetical protein
MPIQERVSKEILQLKKELEDSGVKQNLSYTVMV